MKQNKYFKTFNSTLGGMRGGGFTLGLHMSLDGPDDVLILQ